MRRKRGHIRQRGKNSWEVIVRVPKSLSKDGRDKISVTVRGTYDDAEKKRTELLYQLDHNLLCPNKETVGEYLLQWLESRSEEIARNTYRGYKVCIGHANRHIGHFRLDKIRPADFRSLYKKLIQEENLSGTSVLYVHRTLHKAFEDAAKVEEKLLRNPLESVKPPTKNDYEARVLCSTEEVRKLLQATVKVYPEHMYLIIFLLTTGVRRAEALGTRWEDVDLKAGVVRLRRQIQRQTLMRLKNKKGRVILLPLVTPCTGSSRFVPENDGAASTAKPVCTRSYRFVSGRLLAKTVAGSHRASAMENRLVSLQERGKPPG